MAAILPVDVFSSHQADKRFVDESGGLKSVAGTLAAETAARDFAQVRHEQFEERGLGLRISCPPLLEKECDLARVAFHHNAPPTGPPDYSAVRQIALKL